MSDKPILFSAPMVRAMLEGRKTQTRRILNRARVFATPESAAFTLTGDHMTRALQDASRFRHLGGDRWFWEADAYEHQAPAERTGWMAHLGFAPGDRLWVREAWRIWRVIDDVAPRDMQSGSLNQSRAAIWYEATPNSDQKAGPLKHEIGRLRASIHMPRWASRLTLTVTEVRVERLQDISDRSEANDCGAEGMFATEFLGECSGWQERGFSSIEKCRYHDLWNSINGEGSWDANPWVTATTFEVVKGNIDQSHPVTSPSTPSPCS